MRIFVLMYIIVLLFPYTVRSEEGDPGDYFRKNVVHKRLANGISLIMLNRGFSPTLSFEIDFKVGSVDETYRTAGSAHLLEHMLFKGTDRVGTTNFKEEKKILDEIETIGETLDRLKLINPGNLMIPGLEKRLKELQKEQGKYIVNAPYDTLYTARGGVGLNASTSKDKTGYYIELPSKQLEFWAQLESERLRNPVLREFYLERNNVIEERLMRYGSSGEGSLYELFIGKAFNAHPYRHPIIGWESNIPNLSIKDVRDFYRTYYIPSRMTITIVGKQDVNETERIIKKYFEGIEGRPEPSEITIKEPAMNGETRFSYYFESNPYIIIGWHKPTFPSRDDYIFEMISEILAGGKSSVLYKSMILEKKMLSSVKVWNGTPGSRYDNLLIVFAAPRGAAGIEEAEKEIYAGIDKMAREITSNDLNKIINKMESEIVFGLDTNRGITRLLSHYQTLHGNWEYLADYLKVLKSITVEDIQGAVRKYMIHKNRIVGVLHDSRKK